MRCPSSIVCVLALASGLAAQCQTASGAPLALSPTGVYDALDEGASAELPLGFVFPFAAASIACTHVVVSSNCELYLTDGAGVDNPASLGISTVAEARGGFGGSPRIAAVGGDNWGMDAGAQVLLDASVAGQVKVTWASWSRYNAGQAWDVSVTLFDTGEVQFDYGVGFTGFDSGDIACVSAGDNVGSGLAPSSNFALAGGVVAGFAYMNTWTSPLQLEGTSVRFVPAGGGFTWSVPCVVPAAAHTTFGQGCYDATATAAAYQVFADAAAAELALEGTSLTFTPIPYGYRVDAGAVGYVAPTAGAIDLLLDDDADDAVTPSAPFQYLGSVAVPALQVHSNGFVSMGAGNSNAAYATPASFNLAPVASFRSNVDLDPSAGGRVVWEELAGVVYVTYDGAFRYSTTDAEYFQLQFVLATGVVHMVWQDLSAASTNDLLVGYSPGSPQDNAIDLAVDLPYDCVDQPATSMTASPAPVSTAVGGALVTYAIADLPDATGGSGVHFGAVILSFGGDLAGTDLGILGAPGCAAHITSLDLLLAFVGVGVTDNAVQLALPAGVPAGTLLYAQAVSIQTAGLLNTAGLTTSNGVETLISTF